MSYTQPPLCSMAITVEIVVLMQERAIAATCQATVIRVPRLDKPTSTAGTDCQGLHVQPLDQPHNRGTQSLECKPLAAHEIAISRGTPKAGCSLGHLSLAMVS